MKHNRWVYWVLFLLLLGGCNLPGSAAPGETGPQEEEEEQALPSAAVEEPGSGSLAPEGMDLAGCPPDGGALHLKFSANITLQESEMKLTHILSDGLLSLILDAAGNIRAVEPPQIPYTVSGSVGECTINGQGYMTPGASGTCQAGVVRLIIIEDWAQGEITATCDDETHAFPLPSPGSLSHTGPDGQGEIFYLDNNFTDEGYGAGSTSIRPFARGSGEHIWTLYMDEFPVVPLVP